MLIHIESKTSCKLLTKQSFQNDIERLFVEINFRKMKYLLFGTYRPSQQDDQ